MVLKMKLTRAICLSYTKVVINAFLFELPSFVFWNQWIMKFNYTWKKIKNYI